MSSNPVFAGLRRIFYPFPALDLSPGAIRSDLDAKAERIGESEVENFFADNSSVRAISFALVRFYEDDDAEMALRKAYHLVLEERLRILAFRADPPENYGFTGIKAPDGNHPLDRLVQHLLAREDDCAAASPVHPKIMDRLRQILAAISMGVAFVVSATAVLVLYGRGHIEPKTYRVGAPGFGSYSYWRSVQIAAEEAGVWGDHSLFFALEYRDVSPTILNGSIPYVWVSSLPVQRRRWLREIVTPGIRLFGAVVAALCRDIGDPRVAQVAQDCFFLARHTLKTCRIIHNFQFSHYLDVDEYTATHITKGIVLRKVGTRLVRWPHSHIDSPGATLSYLGYDTFLASGPYMARCFGASWSPKCTSAAVGFFATDRRFTATTRVRTDYRRLIVDHREAGGRIVALFTPSAATGMENIFQNILNATLRQLEPRRQWLLVIKAKGLDAQKYYARILFDDPIVAEMERQRRILVVRYDEPGVEVCPAGWLIKHMDLGIGPGSVQIEALTQGVPALWHLPTFQETPLNEMLVRHALLNKNCESFETALGRRMDDPAATDVPYGWFRENFDPFGDDQALTRIVDLLWGDGLESTMDEAQPSTDRKTA